MALQRLPPYPSAGGRDSAARWTPPYRRGASAVRIAAPSGNPTGRRRRVTMTLGGTPPPPPAEREAQPAELPRALREVEDPIWSAPTRRRFDRGDVSPPAAMPIPEPQVAFDGKKPKSGTASPFPSPKPALRARCSDSGTADPIPGPIFRFWDG